METDRLSEAIALAATAHAGQRDKAGQPYILHPLRVMQGVWGEPAMIAAVLHDTVEDCGLSLDDLRARFGPEVADAVDHLTKREGETYADFIDRCAHNPLARIVKLADLADNMDLRRLGRAPTASDEERMARYVAARERLLAVEAGDAAASAIPA